MTIGPSQPETVDIARSRNQRGPDNERNFAKTLSRGLEILRCFSRTEPHLCNKEIVARTNLPSATISRLTFTLTKLGYLSYDQATRKYRLGSASLAIAYPLLATLLIRQLSRKQMQVLADYCGGAVSIVMCDRLDMVHIEACRQFNAAMELPDIGSFSPLCSSSAGWAMLAAQSIAKREEFFNRIRVIQSDLYRMHQKEMARAIESVETLGYCISFDDDLKVFTVSTPLRQLIHGEMMSFSCSITASAVGKGWLEQDIGPRLVNIARTVGSTLV